VGKRGPQPGFKAKRAQEAAVAGVATAAAAAAPVPDAGDFVCDPVVAARLPLQYREHPEKLGGEALRQLAHRRGLSRSEVDRMTDAKVREQLRFRAYHLHETEGAE
jgi:hypothetical protein